VARTRAPLADPPPRHAALLAQAWDGGGSRRALAPGGRDKYCPALGARSGRDSRNGGKIGPVRLTSSIVFRRTAAWPRSLQWVLLTLAAVLMALAVGWVLFVPAADWLAAHDVGRVTGTSGTLLLQTARDAARGRLLTYGAGLFAAAALIFTARNFTVSRRTLDLTEQGQVTDRYTKAIEQLGFQVIFEPIAEVPEDLVDPIDRHSNSSGRSSRKGPGSGRRTMTAHAMSASLSIAVESQPPLKGRGGWITEPASVTSSARVPGSWWRRSLSVVVSASSCSARLTTPASPARPTMALSHDAPQRRVSCRSLRPQLATSG
jgi:hypothetical protein